MTLAEIPTILDGVRDRLGTVAARPVRSSKLVEVAIADLAHRSLTELVAEETRLAHRGAYAPLSHADAQRLAAVSAEIDDRWTLFFH